MLFQLICPIIFLKIAVKQEVESTLTNSKRDLDQVYNSIMSQDLKIHK